MATRLGCRADIRASCITIDPTLKCCSLDLGEDDSDSTKLQDVLQGQEVFTVDFLDNE